MSFSDYLEGKIVGHVFGGTAYTAPTTIYVGLSTANPDEDASGLAEPTGNGYTRKAVTWSTSGSTATNNGAIEFDTATASWGTITHIGLFDAATSGNMIAYAALSASKAIDTNDIFRIPDGDLDVSIG